MTDSVIMVVDSNTYQGIRVFESRRQLMEELRIKQSTLAGCLKTTKDYPLIRSKWRKYKDPITGEKYCFVELKRTEKIY